MAVATLAPPPCDEPEGPTDLSRIHNCDQRVPVISFAHEVLGPEPLQFEQRGVTDPGFVPGTSSVLWPVARNMAAHLCDHPDLVRGRSVIELGAGLGIVGAAAAALGAGPAAITDCRQALPLLGRNRALLSERGVSVEVCELSWGDAAHHAEALALLETGAGDSDIGFDIVLASDVVLMGFDTERLWESCEALVSRDPSRSATILIGFEFREDWETIGAFTDRAEAAGFETSFCLLKEDDDEDDEDCDRLLYTYHRGPPWT